MRTTTLVNTEDNHRKFYIVTVDGCRVILRWGRLGQAGQQQTRDFLTTTAANVFAREKVWSKISREYVKVS